MKKTIKPALILFSITLIAQLFSTGSASAQATTENTLFERLWMSPAGDDQMDTFMDPEDRYHLVVVSRIGNTPNNALYYTFREFGTWYYIVVESTEQDDVSRLDNPVMKMDENGVIHLVYVRNGKLAYVQIDEERNVIRKPGMDRFVYGLSLMLDDNGLPHISYVNRNIINPVNFANEDVTNLMQYATFDGDDWHFETVNNTLKRHFGAIPRSKIFIDDGGELNVLFYRMHTRTLVLSVKTDDEWVVSDSLIIHPLRDRLHSFDLITNKDGSIQGCIGGVQRVAYLTVQQGVVSVEVIDFSSTRRQCAFTVNKQDEPVIFAYNSILGTAIARKSGEEWEISPFSSNRYNQPAKIDVDSDGQIALLTLVWDPGYLIFSKGDELQGGVFTGLYRSWQDEGRFKTFYSDDDRIYAYHTRYEPEAFEENGTIKVNYFASSDIHYASPETAAFDRTIKQRESGNNRRIMAALHHNGLYIKLKSNFVRRQNVAGGRFHNLYNVDVLTSQNGSDWAHAQTIEDIILERPRLFQALDRFWIVDTGGYYTSVDGSEWEYAGPMPDIFEPTDQIQLLSGTELDGKAVFVAVNRGHEEPADPSCLVCPTGRSGSYLLFYDDTAGWSYEQFTDKAPGGFVRDGDELLNVTIGRTYRTTDGVNWTSEPNTLERVPGQVVKSDMFFFATDQILLEQLAPGVVRPGNFYLSRDGVTWQRVPFHDNRVNDNRYRMFAKADRLMVADVQDGIIYEWGDGDDWGAGDARIVPYLSFDGDPPDDLVFSGRWSSHQGHDVVPTGWRYLTPARMAISHFPDMYGLFVGSRAPSGNTTVNSISYWNGLEWESILTPNNWIPSHMLAYNDGQRTRLIAALGSEFGSNNNLMSWDGEGWTDITDAEYDIAARAIATFSANGTTYLVVAGVGNPTASNFLGLWDGENWTYYSGESYNNLLPVGTMTTMNMDGKEYLYVGGNITAIDNTAAIRYARFDGESWESIDGVTNDEPLHMTTLQNENDEDYMVITGRFTTAGLEAELDVNGMVAFDGTHWHKLSPELNGERIMALEALQTQSGSVLFAAGLPSIDEQQELNSIGVLHDGEWRGLDNGVDGTIYTLAILNDGRGPILYAYGNFKRAGSVTALGLARIPLYYNGRSISNLLEQVNEGENQILDFPQLNLTLAGNVVNAGWMNVDQREQQINPDELPENMAGAIDLIWEFNLNTVLMSDVHLSTLLADDDIFTENGSGKHLADVIANTDANLTWLMESDGGWIDLGGLPGNGQLVSVTPTSTLTRATIGLLDGPGTTHSEDSDVPREFALDQNYPNPFNPSTTIRFHLPESAVARLDVYDILGRRVGTLVNDHLTAGAHSVAFDGSMLASGLYLYRLQAGDRVTVRKMMLVK